MSNTSTKKKKVKIVPPQDISDVMTETEPVELDLTKTSTATPAIPDSALINVRSNVFGQLFFIDPVTKEEVYWAQCGEVQQLPMATLRHMKNGAVKFFTNQMVVLTGFADDNAEKYEVADIYKSLYITQYYKNYLDPTDFSEICSWTPEEVKEKVAMLPKQVKEDFALALNTFVEKGILDSLKLIKAFEDALGCELRRPN